MARGACGRSGADARSLGSGETRRGTRASPAGVVFSAPPLAPIEGPRRATSAPPRALGAGPALPTPRASVESRDESSARERRVAKCAACVPSPVAPPRTARGSVSGWHLGTEGAIEPLSVAPLADLDPTGVQVSTPTDWSRLFAHRTKPVRKTVGDASDPSDEPLWVC